MQDTSKRSFLTRGRVISYKSDGAQHVANISGLAGEQLQDVPRIQQFGLSSHPVGGSHVLFARLGGVSEKATILGVESLDHGPRDLKEGESALYDAHKNIMKLSSEGVSIKGDVKIALECKGNQLGIDENGIFVTVNGVTTHFGGNLTSFSGDRVEHNGKNIGKDHTHQNVTPGSANSGVPNA